MNGNGGVSHHAKREPGTLQEQFQCSAARVRALEGRRAHGFRKPAFHDHLKLRLLGKPQQGGAERLRRDVELDDLREIDRCRGNVLGDEQTRRRQYQRPYLPPVQQILDAPLPKFAVPASKGKHIGADTIKHGQGLATQ